MDPSHFNPLTDTVICSKELTVDGRRYTPGDELPKEPFTHEQLRQLIRVGHVAFQPPNQPAPQVVVKTVPAASAPRDAKEYPYVCEDCGQRFKRPVNLGRHWNAKHKKA